MANKQMDLPGGKWDVLLADPPWMYKSMVRGLKQVGDRLHYADHFTGAAAEYPLMSDEEIYGLHPESVMADPGVLFLWTTGPKMDIAFRALDVWGLHYRGTAFVWVKTRLSDGLPMGAKGPRPSIVKPLAEMVLVASNRQKGRPLPIADEKVSQIVMAPRREHSRKPDEVQDRIDRLYPTASKLEMFSRRQRGGWDSWGNEITNTYSVISTKDGEEDGEG